MWEPWKVEERGQLVLRRTTPVRLDPLPRMEWKELRERKGCHQGELG